MLFNKVFRRAMLIIVKAKGIFKFLPIKKALSGGEDFFIF